MKWSKAGIIVTFGDALFEGKLIGVNAGIALITSATIKEITKIFQLVNLIITRGR